MFHLRINVAVMCIVMLLATTVDAGIFKPRNLGVLGRYKQQYKVKLIKREANEFFQRVPDALVKSFVEYSKGYVSTSAMMMPVEIVLNYKQIEAKGRKQVFRACLQKASEWGQRSGTYKATETFLSEMRQTNDCWNSYIASGITSTMTKRKSSSTVFQNAKAFCSGFGSALAIDTIKSVAKKKGLNIFKTAR